MDLRVPLFFLVVLVVGGLLGWFVVRSRRGLVDRPEAIELVAEALGLTYDAGPDSEVIDELHDVAPMSTSGGTKGTARNLLTGRHRGHEVRWFDYVCVVSDGRAAQQVSFAVALVYLSHEWPDVVIAPETLDHKAYQAFGGDDIDFESQEFSDRFWVRSDDRKFTYALLHPRAIEHVLTSEWERWNVRGDVISLWTSGKPPVDEIERALDDLVGLVDLAPAFLRPRQKRAAIVAPKRQG